MAARSSFVTKNSVLETFSTVRIAIFSLDACARFLIRCPPNVSHWKGRASPEGREGPRGKAVQSRVREASKAR